MPPPLPHIAASHRALSSRCTPLGPLVQLVVPLPILMPPPSIRWRFCLLLRHHLSSHPSLVSCLAGCRITSPQAAASHLLVPAPLVTPSPLVPLVPLVWMVFMLPIFIPPPPICWRHHLSSPLGHLVRLVVKLPLLTPPPLIASSLLVTPLLVHCAITSRCTPLGNLVRLVIASTHSSCHHLPSAGTFSLIAPLSLAMHLLGLLSVWLSRCLSSCCCLPSASASTSHCTIASWARISHAQCHIIKVTHVLMQSIHV